MYKLIGDETQGNYESILKLINLRKNGVVADSMKNAGLNYKVNYGVSIVDLRKISKQYKCDNILANMLWNKGWRESYILATLLADAETMETEVLMAWCSDIPTGEIAEQLGNNLLTKLNETKVLDTLLSLNNNLVRTAIFKAFARKFMLKDFALTEYFKTIVNKDLLEPKIHRKLMANALGQAVGYYIRNSNNSVNYFKEQIHYLVCKEKDFELALKVVETELNELSQNSHKM